jgi:hypothetical protein
MYLDSELDDFKRAIDLRQFAVSLGYEIDRRESWRGSTVLRHGGDKIVVKRNGNGHYVFFSVKDDRDNGTIIDFVQRRQYLSLGAVRQILRPWIRRPAAELPLFPRLEPAGPDRIRMENAYRRMRDATRHPYLENERYLPAALLKAPRFVGRVRIDRRGNAVFPHFDLAGLCGYEIKNRHYTGFASGGRKGLWLSHGSPDDQHLVLAESAIDALSHAALFPDDEDKTRYASLGGKPSSQQLTLLEAIAAKLPTSSEVVAAFDADGAGRTLVEVAGAAVRAVAHRKERMDLIFRSHLPEREGEDWNQVLQNFTCQKWSRRGKTNSCPG